jgi:hypothetical protein
MQAVLKLIFGTGDSEYRLLLTGMVLGQIMATCRHAFWRCVGQKTAIVIVTRTHTPVALRDRVRMWRDVTWLSSMGVVAVGITHYFFAQNQSQLLVGFAIVALWLLIGLQKPCIVQGSADMVGKAP